MQKIKEHSFSSICILLLFIFMLLLPRQVFLGAKSGLLLWFQTILPTLLPFSMISNIMIETNSIYYISNAVGPVLRPFFRVSSAGVFAIVIGFLCGYPLGAKVIGQLLKNDAVSREEAEYLLSFCNNVSPIFLINYLVISALQRVSLMCPVLMIMIASPILCSFLFRFGKCKNTIPESATSDIQIKPFRMKILNRCMMDSFEMMVYLGGYIMAFSILFTLLIHLPGFGFLTCLLPFLEVTNGISLIQTFPLSFAQRFIFTLSICSFGGICAIFQTQLVLSGTSLSVWSYTKKKLVTMLVTSLLACLYLLFI
ncbi:MAG: transporter [Hespellia sp.]|nr:transporter [Hespellia sp.]